MYIIEYLVYLCTSQSIWYTDVYPIVSDILMYITEYLVYWCTYISQSIPSQNIADVTSTTRTQWMLAFVPAPRERRWRSAYWVE